MSSTTYAVRRNQNLVRAHAQVQYGPVWLGLVTVAAISILALLYLNQITKTGVFGYKLTALTQQRDQLLADKQGLEVEAARLQSISAIQAAAAVSKMVPQGQVTYAAR